MNQSQTQFLRAVALQTPYAFSETGDVAPESNATTTTYPAPPTFSINELLPALRSERAKVGWIGFGAGLALAAGGFAIYRNTRRRSSRK